MGVMILLFLFYLPLQQLFPLLRTTLSIYYTFVLGVSFFTFLVSITFLQNFSYIIFFKSMRNDSSYLRKVKIVMMISEICTNGNHWCSDQVITNF